MNEARNVTQTTAATGETPSRSGGARWRLPLLLAVVLAAIIAARLLQRQERSPASLDAAAPLPVDATGKTVSLLIEFGDGRERMFDAVAWHSGMTVDDLMSATSRLPGGIAYRAEGDRDMKLLVSIGDTVNERDGGRNWTYQVNDVPADRSLAVYELQPGDRVLWTFGRLE